jgi:hypothetical protein
VHGVPSSQSALPAQQASIAEKVQWWFCRLQASAVHALLSAQSWSPVQHRAMGVELQVCVATLQESAVQGFLSSHPRSDVQQSAVSSRQHPGGAVKEHSKDWVLQASIVQATPSSQSPSAVQQPGTCRWVHKACSHRSSVQTSPSSQSAATVQLSLAWRATPTVPAGASPVPHDVIASATARMSARVIGYRTVGQPKTMSTRCAPCCCM